MLLLHAVIPITTTHMTLTAAAATVTGTAAFWLYTRYRAPLSAEFIPSLTIKASDLVQDGASLAPQVAARVSMSYCSY
jgi:hypothetical protein